MVAVKVRDDATKKFGHYQPAVGDLPAWAPLKPATVKAKLTALIDQTQADEVMITSMIYDHAARIRSYELMADAFALNRAPQAVAS